MNMKTVPLGDKHRGKSTALIESDGVRYIVKHRDCKTEKAFAKFCEGIAELGFCVFSRSPEIIEEGVGFHTEAVEENIPTDGDGIDRYYLRAGALLFFAYLFGSNDLHFENIIASGDVPVIVDFETLFTGKVSRQSEKYNLSRSVMRSHLLCNFAEVNGRVADVSGLSGASGDLKNIPYTLNGRVYLWERADIFIDGFSHAYRFVMKNTDEIADLLRLFDNCRFRQILRPTQTYHTMSAYLRGIAESEREKTAYDMLSRAYKNDLDSRRLDLAKDILKEEVRSVLAGEIPLFCTYGNGCDLMCDTHTVFEDHLQLSPVGYAAERLREMSEDDLVRQIAVIRLAVAASVPLDKCEALSVNIGTYAPGEICAKTVANAEVPFLPYGFCGLNGGVNGNVSFTSAGAGLYSGLAGIMCMFAAVYRRTGKTEYRDLLMRYREEFDGLLRGNGEIVLNDKNVSLGDGITGIIMGFLHMGELTEITQFKQDAVGIARRLSASDGLANCDYLNGAGALPVALRKCGAADSSAFSDIAAVFDGVVPYTTGMAHGASGIALAVSALNVNNLSKTFDKAVLDMIKWDNKEYSAENANWYDLRNPEKRGFMSGWCSGAPGIGMARKALMKYTDNREVLELCERDIARAVSFIRAQTAAKRDTLCCGMSARLMAASNLGVECNMHYGELCRRETEGKLRLFHIADTADVNVSLMQGMAGVAYALAMYGDPLSGGMLV